MLFYETNHRKERNDGKDTPLTVTEQHTHGIDLHRNTPGIPQGIDAAVAETTPLTHFKSRFLLTNII